MVMPGERQTSRVDVELIVLIAMEERLRFTSVKAVPHRRRRIVAAIVE